MEIFLSKQPIHTFNFFFFKKVSQLLKTKRKKLYDNKYFYGTFNLNFSLQNKKLQRLTKICIDCGFKFVEVAYFEEKSLTLNFHRSIYYHITL